jgi:hypothetical protein
LSLPESPEGDDRYGLSAIRAGTSPAPTTKRD